MKRYIVRKICYLLDSYTRFGLELVSCNGRAEARVYDVRFYVEACQNLFKLAACPLHVGCRGPCPRFAVLRKKRYRRKNIVGLFFGLDAEFRSSGCFFGLCLCFYCCRCLCLFRRRNVCILYIFSLKCRRGCGRFFRRAVVSRNYEGLVFRFVVCLYIIDFFGGIVGKLVQYLPVCAYALALFLFFLLFFKPLFLYALFVFLVAPAELLICRNAEILYRRNGRFGRCAAEQYRAYKNSEHGKYEGRDIAYRFGEYHCEAAAYESRALEFFSRGVKLGKAHFVRACNNYLDQDRNKQKFKAVERVFCCGNFIFVIPVPENGDKKHKNGNGKAHRSEKTFEEFCDGSAESTRFDGYECKPDEHG